ncbi:LytR/AlgR family response regulator transcription factor [Micromonospora sp. DT48]|uniref:LytR/AlgR family response regulator transcription factor n=1 Tax=unclassified Micromonospora TaxID=2617518 RepID=UPI001328BCB8|nr:LytTR family DNA-binding domain-containing protein [Micromonospora sp. CP22]MTK03834.1 response regulator transcription factor [Micromonospora sp. CP22]
MIRALVVDDEPPARRRLIALLGHHPDVTVCGSCGSADEAVHAITVDRPDVVFLDVAMPGADGFTVLDELADPPAVVFVTAHTRYATRAFDVAAVDYLVKPYHRERLAMALDRLRAHLRHRRPAVGRLAVGTGGHTRLLDPAEVDYLRADGNYVRVYVGSASYPVRATLTALLSTLDSTAFLRVHRSLAVRLDRVRDVQTLRHGELALRLRNGALLISGRSYRDEVRRALGLHT